MTSKLVTIKYWHIHIYCICLNVCKYSSAVFPFFAEVIDVPESLAEVAVLVVSENKINNVVGSSLRLTVSKLGNVVS